MNNQISSSKKLTVDEVLKIKNAQRFVRESLKGLSIHEKFKLSAEMWNDWLTRDAAL